MKWSLLLRYFLVGWFVAGCICCLAKRPDHWSNHPPDPNPKPYVAQGDKAQEAIVEAVNRYRAKYDLPALIVDPILTQVARQRAPYYDHHACGCWSWEAAHAAGFKGPVSDNLCRGATSAEEAVTDGWGGEDRERNPAGHNYQMQGYMNINGRWADQHFNRIGVAHAGPNWIAVFGRAEDK